LQLPNKLVYWRALLQQLLCDNVGFVCDDWRVGKICPKGLNFATYARKALARLGLEYKVSGHFIMLIFSTEIERITRYRP